MRYSLLQLVRPENPAIDPADVIAHIRAPCGETDPEILRIIDAAIEDIDGNTGWLGRALVTQKWRLITDSFPCGPLRLPLPPLQAVNAISYTDPEGDAQTIHFTGDDVSDEAADYRVVTDGTPGFIEPLYGKTWPAARCLHDGIRVDFTCGYGPDADSIPARIKQWLKTRCAEFYMNREETVVGTTISPVPGVDTALNQFRFYY